MWRGWVSILVQLSTYSPTPVAPSTESIPYYVAAPTEHTGGEPYGMCRAEPAPATQPPPSAADLNTAFGHYAADEVPGDGMSKVRVDNGPETEPVFAHEASHAMSTDNGMCVARPPTDAAY